MKYNENAMLRCQHIHYEIANTVAQMLEKRMKGGQYVDLRD